MTEDIYNLVQRAAILMAIEAGIAVEEDGILLNKSTVELVSEIEEMNRQHLIVTALATGNKNLFMQLTTNKGVNC